MTRHEAHHDLAEAMAQQPAAALNPRICITAGEAYPELERLFLSAEREILASFRIFDPATRLRSPEGLAIGKTWFDLIVHVLRKGVTFYLYITDFDPIAATDLHRITWKSIRLLVAARETAEAGARFHFVPAAHPARVGLLPALFFAPRIYKELRNHARWLSEMSPDERARTLRDAPGLRPYLAETANGVRPVLRLPQLIPATHHQKIVVVDRRRVAVGGLDLNERRWDTPQHERAPEETWHDVQIFFEDDIRGDSVARHILSLQRVTGGLMAPPAVPGLLRTLSARRRGAGALISLSPRNVCAEITLAHKRNIAASERLIYIETQFFRDLKTANRLARAARRNPRLKLLLVLPAAPEDVAFNKLRRADARFGEWLQARCVRMIRRAFGDRLFIASPAIPRRYESEERDSLWGAPIIYVHAKVSIFDERAALVASANLNGRSLYWDSEAGVELTDRDEVTALRERCLRHWFPDETDPTFFDPRTAMEACRRRAVQNLRADPEDRRGFLLPYDPGPAERFGRDLPVVPDEMV